MRKINKDSDTKFSKFKHVKITNEKRLFANRDGEIHGYRLNIARYIGIIIGKRMTVHNII